MVRRLATVLGLLWCMGGVTPPAQAADDAPPLITEWFETVVRLPVTVRPLEGNPYTGSMVLTHFRPPGEGPFAAVVMLHGRSSTDRATPARYRYPDVVRYWLRRGVAVFVPTRLGYGDSGVEHDPEYSGLCASKKYEPAAMAMKEQVRVIVEYALRMPWVDDRRVLVMGQSMGGFGAIAAMGLNHPAIVAGVNFAGGAGGDVVTRPANPCGADRLASLFAEIAQQSHPPTPMLWLYAQNDQYWGADIPTRWLDAYLRGGGQANFAMFGAVGSDGHQLLSQGMGLWRPVLDEFAAKYLQVTIPHAEHAPAPSGFALIADRSRVPLVRPEVRDGGYARFLNLDVPRAFAIGPRGEWASQTGDDVMAKALERCAAIASAECKLYAVDDAVVWRP